MTDSPVRTPRRRWAIDVVAMMAMLGVVVVAFATTFDDETYLVSAIGGVVLGTTVAIVSAIRSWGPVATAIVTFGVYLTFGGALAMPSTTVFGIPTLTTLSHLLSAVVTSWKEYVTDGAPLSTLDGHAVVPLLLLLVASVLAVSLALRARTATLALIPVVLALVLQAALGVSSSAFPVAQGVTFALIAVAWLSVRNSVDSSRMVVEISRSTTSTIRPARRASGRMIRAVSVLAVGAFAALAVAFTTTPGGPRSVLRDSVEPPFAVESLTSPMQSFRHYVRDEAGTAQFTVTDMPAGARLRLATLDAYDGSVMRVSDDSGTGQFRPLRSDRTDVADGERDVTVTVGSYSGVWVPTIGEISALSYEGERAHELRRSSFLNADTETVIATEGLEPGDRYVLTTTIDEQADTEASADAPFAAVAMPVRTGVPDSFADIAIEAVGEAETPMARVRALQDWLLTEGFFSHGLEGEAPSRPGHGAVRLQEFLQETPIVGDDEQYAAAFVLLADQLGIPARVVMGWHSETADAQFSATGNDVHAWVEVAFEDAGWIAFDVTPPTDKTPTEQATVPRSDPRPQVLQPPPPIQEPADDPPIQPEDRSPRETDTDDPDDVPSLPLVAIALTTGGLLLCALPFLLVLAAKALRRRRRVRSAATADSISGGWAEVTDAARDYAVVVAPGATRAQSASTIQAAFPDVPILALARSADAHVFGPGTPTPADASTFWENADSAIHGMGISSSRAQRMRAKISVRSLGLWGRTPIVLASRRGAGEGGER